MNVLWKCSNYFIILDGLLTVFHINFVNDFMFDNIRNRCQYAVVHASAIQ